MSAVAPGARTVEVRGRLFKFDPERISVTAGEDVAIMLTSEGAEHDFKVEGVEGHVSAAKGKIATGGFRFDKPGEYIFYCSVSGHREAGMEGRVVVT